MRFLRIPGGGVVRGKGDNAGAGLEGGASRAVIGRVLDGAKLEAHTLPLYPVSKSFQGRLRLYEGEVGC